MQMTNNKIAYSIETGKIIVEMDHGHHSLLRTPEMTGSDMKITILERNKKYLISLRNNPTLDMQALTKETVAMNNDG